MPAEKFVIEYKHLHPALKKRVDELREARLIRLGTASGASYLALKPANRLVKQATEKIGETIRAGKLLQPKISSELERLQHEFIGGPNSLFEQYGTKKLLEKYPYAFVKRQGDIVLTNKEHGAKNLGVKLGRMRVPTR